MFWRRKSERLICIVGESGSGKTTLAKALARHGYTQVDSYSTRPPRHLGEDGHTFVDQAGFDRIRKDLVAYTLFDGYEYGATRRQVRSHQIYVVDPAGVAMLSDSIGRHNLMVVLLQTWPMTRLRRMTDKRGREAAERRLEYDREKFDGFVDFDLVLRNEDSTDFKTNVRVLLTLMKGFFG